ncbi:mitochondrial fission factor isoform X1 [Octopus bimaculoides]|uniref:Mitochondrial fission factor n=1 Tax=Octopus bimaculoides TaxID=37653 RepID=A0A0L8GHZ9_OCTBM|nr:mitochondrial fission factor isoform X1 [Octopus bimaculoides]|eukprot:XP_014781205.1 PREDICTED: mitochondrial fission factor-like isoform X1 [Octopus bimaculoides]
MSETSALDVEPSTEKAGFVQSLPSDFSDVQPRNYDPNYISEISNQMQIPDRLQYDGTVDSRSKSPPLKSEVLSNMTIPERLVFVGEDKHVGLKSTMRQFDFDNIPQTGASYVGMITPPRTLTLEEQFPFVEDSAEPERHKRSVMPLVRNGVNTQVYTPGTSPGDTLLLNDEDEATLLRTHLAKLTRRIVSLEQENQKRAQRDLIIYPTLLGYMLWKVLTWFFRSN